MSPTLLAQILTVAWPAPGARAFVLFFIFFFPFIYFNFFFLLGFLGREALIEVRGWGRGEVYVTSRQKVAGAATATATLVGPSPCLFEQIRILQPKKYDYQKCSLIIDFLGCQLAKCPTAKSRCRFSDRPYSVKWSHP
jgi:hypothetical protein